MDGDSAPLKSLSQLCNEQQAWLMIDDAHGFGVLGSNGGGSALAQDLTTDECPIYMATLGKALGSYGAFVAGSETLIESLIQFSRNYIYTTALPPSIAAASLAAVKLLKDEAWRQQHLNHLIKLFKQQAKNLGLPLMPSDTAIQPLMVGSSAVALQLSEALKDMGLLVTAIRPPTVPKDTARLRITLSSAHTESHLQQLLQALVQLQQQGLLTSVEV
jgi:8-amino-7-oxononanoate synthase